MDKIFLKFSNRWWQNVASDGFGFLWTDQDEAQNVIEQKLFVSYSKSSQTTHAIYGLKKLMRSRREINSTYLINLFLFGNYFVQRGWNRELLGYLSDPYDDTTLCGWISGSGARKMESMKSEEVKNASIEHLKNFTMTLDIDIPDPVRILR